MNATCFSLGLPSLFCWLLRECYFGLPFFTHVTVLGWFTHNNKVEYIVISG